MSHTSSKKSITQAEYYQLLGLRSIADKYNEMAKNCAVAARDITQELDHDGKPDDMGHTYDCIYGSRAVEEMLELIGLTIEKTGD